MPPESCLTPMPTLKRQDIPALWQAIAAGKTTPVYLLFGERYLCRQVADELSRHLLPDEGQRQRNLHAIDGDREEAIATLNSLRTFSLLPGRQLFRVTDSKLFYSKGVAKTLWDKAKKAHDQKDAREAGRLLAQMLDLAGLGGDSSGEELTGLAAGRWRTLFGFAKPQEKMEWVAEGLAQADHAPTAGKSGPAGDAADLFVTALEGGLPAGNILILVAEAVDKRKRLFKYLEANATVVDLSVDTGASSAARKDQDAIILELVQKTLAGFAKKIDPRALPLLLDRVGFHPVAAVMETEKLALSVGDAPTITIDDLEEMIGRTREEALFAFTEAVAGGNLTEALTSMARLRENQVHPLVMVSGLRNHLRKLLLIRALEEEGVVPYPRGLQFNAFQGYLNQLKATRQQWPEALNGHPFVLYKLFGQAERFPVAALKSALADLLEAEYRLKGSNLPDDAILENMLFSILDAARPQTAPQGGRR